MRNSGIYLVGKDDLPRSRWLTSESSEGRIRYVAPFIENGLGSYVANANAEVAVLVCDGQVMPVVFSDGARHDTNLISLRSHYVDYPRQELDRLDSRSLRLLIGVGLRVLGSLIDTTRLGRVVYVNNWLWPTNPAFELTKGQAEGITAYLTSRFEDRAIVIRSLDAHTTPEMFGVLRSCGYDLIRSRRIYLLDPTPSDFRLTRDAKRDLKQVERTGYSIRRPRTLSDAQAMRATSLYRSLYLERYSRLNAAYTERYFKHLVRSGCAEVRIFLAQDRMDAITAWKVDHVRLGGILVGHDPKIPRRKGLLRHSLALEIREACRTGLIFNMGAGSAEFKLNRGAFPVIEYDAIYSRHLGFRKRRAWSLLGTALSLWQRLERRTVV